MATVFMKWLETRPNQYERGISLLTLGRLEPLGRQLTESHIGPGDRVLEIGCGTGRLTRKLLKAGAQVTAIDLSADMIAAARQSIPEDLQPDLELMLADATQIRDKFEAGSFDRIVISLTLSELAPQNRRFVLRSAHELLTSEGEILVIDETVPARLLHRWLYFAIHLPLRAVTWLLTRASTHPLRHLPDELKDAGFQVDIEQSQLAGSLVLACGRAGGPHEPFEAGPVVLGQLESRRTLRTVLLDIWAVFFRLIPPYPHFEPGLYRLGSPNKGSPLLVTGNFDLTVRRLTASLDGRLDAWVLVVDSAGINVWCAAGGGFLTAEGVIGALRASGLDGYLDHHVMILPQLCANGVDGWKIRQSTRWGVHWGPARAADVPSYLAAGRKKTDAMRWVTFPLGARLEMMAATLGFYALLILIPVAIFWRSLFWPMTFALFALSGFYALTLPWIPGHDGLEKSGPLAIIAVAGMLVYSWLWDPASAAILFGRAVGMIALSVFIAAELQGMSPRMRGEQANWTWEA
ncbi:MAG: corrinoid protein-associated methyltransferase CpaM, partial [Anaerolineales bacterium]